MNFSILHAVPVAEIKLAAIIACFLIGVTRWARQDLRKGLVVYVLGCGAGWLSQLALGAEMNRYTPNITLYASYVSVAVILAWGTGLSMMWAGQFIVARWLRRGPGLAMFLLAAVPVMTILESIGSNVIRMKLHNYHQYAPLMPQLNSMHAPVWLFVYYGVCAVLFYGALKALRINGGDWRAARWAGRSQAMAQPNPAPEACEEVVAPLR